MVLRSLLNKFKSRGKFVNDMIWTVTATLIVGGSALLLQTLVGVYYNAEGIGVYSQVIAYYMLLTALGNFGVENSTLKHTAEFSHDKNKLKNIYISSQLLTLGIATVVMGVTYVLISYFSNIFSSTEVANGLLYCLPGVLFFSLNKNSNVFDSGLRKIKLYSIIRSVRWISIMLLVFGVLFFNIEYNYVFLSFSLVEFLISCCFLISHREYLAKINDYNWFKIHFKYGYTNVLASIMSVLSANLLILISGYYLTKSETGVVSFMVTFTYVFYVVSSSIQVNFNPIFAKKWADRDIEGINDSVRKIFKFVLIAFLPILIFTIILYYCYIKLFMPIEFKSTVNLFIVMAIGTCVNFTFSWPSVMLNMSGEVYKNLLRNTLTFIMNIILSYSFISFLGIEGVVISNLLIPVFAVYISYYLIKRFLGINIIKIIINSLK